jgi:DNA-binding winged helix-turn-helix (wHTH) protein
VHDPFRLGDWLVEPQLNRVSGTPGAVHLEPRAMDLLVFFARHPGEVLSREALIDGVWSTQFVGEAVLRNTVAALRRALGDRADSPTYIETISKRGYRLIAPVTMQGSPPASSSVENPCFKITWKDEEIPLAEGDSLIGRDAGAAVRIDSPEVSRRHARLTVHGDVVTVEDLGSKNGTYRNGRRLKGRERLADGDEIWIGLNLARMRFNVCDELTKTER